MKAVVFQAPFSIAAENVPDPELQHPNDGLERPRCQGWREVGPLGCRSSGKMSG